MGPLGVRNIFRLMSLVCAVTCVVYFILNRLFFAKAQEERKLKAEQEDKKQKESKGGEVKAEKELGNVENGTKKDIKEKVSSEEASVNRSACDSSAGGQLNSAFKKEE